MKNEKYFYGVRFVLILIAFLLLMQACGDRPGREEGLVSADTTSRTEDTEDKGDKEKGKPGRYKVIFNSDTTHIMQCASPYHAGNADSPITKKMVRSAVTEALDAGADCFVITPGHCWVPWWPSRYFAEHTDWYYNKLGGRKSGNPFWTYIHVIKHDLIQEQIDVCREYGAGVFINFRLNDAHMINRVEKDTADVAFAAEIFAENPEYAIGSCSDGTNEAVLDFRHKAVRDNRLKLIGELIENYEIDGFELDFCRRFAFFNKDKTTAKTRIEIMTSFVSEVRKMLDAATSKDGRFRHLSVRIPAWPDYYKDLGIDLEKFEEAGVTIFNFTGSYFMAQDFDLKTLAKPIRNADIYYELQFITAVDYDENDGKRRIHRRSTEEQLYTTALIAYEQGADGISFFNFQYYRGDRQGKGDEPLTEPPWEVIKNVKDIDFMKSRGRYFFYGQTWKDRIRKDWKLPLAMSAGSSEKFDMFIVPAGGSDGVFRLQSTGKISDRNFTVVFNGRDLERAAYAGEAFENEYTQMIGKKDNYLCFKVPSELMKEGINRITVKMTGGDPVVLCFTDLTVG